VRCTGTVTQRWFTNSSPGPAASTQGMSYGSPEQPFVLTATRKILPCCPTPQSVRDALKKYRRNLPRPYPVASARISQGVTA
jgi:hypothetical protein